MFMKSFAWVKALSLAVVVGGSALLIAGCAQENQITDNDWVPGYTSQENGDRILRDTHYNIEEMWDDIDSQVLMDRPTSHLTWWSVTQSN